MALVSLGYNTNAFKPLPHIPIILCEWADGCNLVHNRSFGTIRQLAFAGIIMLKLLSWYKNKRAVTHQRISETRAGRVEKIAKFLTRQTHVGNTFKTRYKRVGYAWCTSGTRRCTSLKVSARFARDWAKKCLNMLKNFLKARRVPGV